jgi:hypothetical protein
MSVFGQGRFARVTGEFDGDGAAGLRPKASASGYLFRHRDDGVFSHMR